MDNKVTIAAYKPEYKNAFRELNLWWIEKYFRVEKKDLEQLDHPEQCLKDGGQIFFTVHHGEPVGTCALYKIGPGRFELAKMGVDPKAHGLGLGDALMLAAEKWAREQGAHEIILLSNVVLEPAITLYKKHGYVTTHLGPNPEYERCNIEMSKSLK